MGDAKSSKPCALPRTLSRARKMTVTTVTAGQVMHIRTTCVLRIVNTVEQLYTAASTNEEF